MVIAEFWHRSKNLGIIVLSIVGGLAATVILPRVVDWIPYDYLVYVQGGRMIRDGINPHAMLPYWYPLPITLFTTVLWSFLPDQFAWAFAFIPLGLLHLRYGKSAPLAWLFFPLLINLAYAQAEAWLLFPMFWLLNDEPTKSSIGILALMFKPAYGMLIVPYRIVQWIRDRCWRNLSVLIVLGIIMFGAAFIVDPAWIGHFIDAILHRGDNPELRVRNMTLWAFARYDWIGYGLAILAIAILLWLSIRLWRHNRARADVLLAWSLFIFPNGLNPVSSMMVLPLMQTPRELLALVIVSWGVAGLDIIVGGFGGVYLLIVLVALVIKQRRLALQQAAVL